MGTDRIFFAFRIAYSKAILGLSDGCKIWFSLIWRTITKHRPFYWSRNFDPGTGKGSNKKVKEQILIYIFFLYFSVITNRNYSKLNHAAYELRPSKSRASRCILVKALFFFIANLLTWIIFKQDHENCKKISSNTLQSGEIVAKNNLYYLYNL